MTPRFPERIEKLRERLDADKLDSLLISNSENRRYLSGFVGTAGWLFITRQACVLATDFRYLEQAALQAPGFRVDRITGKMDWMPRLAAEFRAMTVGFEADNITVASFERIKQAFIEAKDIPQNIQLKPTQGITLALRARKDPKEIELLQRAITIGDEAFEEVERKLRPGMLEEEVAWEIEKAVRARGAESISFETIVANGANAARPHHRAAEDRITEGCTIVIDMGARYQGYCSDLTRTVVLGEPDKMTRKIYDIVYTAQQAAIELVRSGMSGADCDAIARRVISEAGYADAFGHSLGHGVGLEVHESPGVGSTSPGKLEDGMVFTIEPGIYLSGWGGVRIEDVVVLENGKARVLSHARKARI